VHVSRFSVVALNRVLFSSEQSAPCDIARRRAPLATVISLQQQPRPRPRGLLPALPRSMSSSSRKPSRRSNPSQPQEKPYQFKARPAPKNNVKSSFAVLKDIVDTPVSASLAQVESGFRVS
jgi:hypothetical protein